MSLLPLGQPQTVSVTFDTGTLTVPNLFDPTTVTLRWMPSGGAAQTSSWTVAAPGTVIVRDSLGKFHGVLPTSTAGLWRYEWLGYDAASKLISSIDGYFAVDSSAFTSQAPLAIGVNGYPYLAGYCDVQHVMARVNAGGWDPTSDTNELPSIPQVTQFIQEASATVDLALAKTGYYVPLKPQPGFAVIGQSVFTHLQAITANLATAMVERVRHGSAEQNEDHVSDYWMKLADDLLARIEDGTDNFTLFGVDGGFKPQANQALAASIGGLQDANGNTTTPLFTRTAMY